MEKIERILILRPDNIGDCILFSGALRWIRAKYPNSRIDLAVKPHIRELFELCPYVDRVVSCDRFFPWNHIRRHFLKGTWCLERCLLGGPIRHIWYPRYDLVIYPVSAPGEEYLAAIRYLDAKEKWGFGGRMLNIVELDDPLNAPEKVFTHFWHNTDENMWKHELWRTKMFLEMCGFSVGDIYPCFWLSEKDEEFASSIMPPRSVLGIFPGADAGFRCWPVAKWESFFRQQNATTQLVIFGGEKERELSAQIAQVAQSCFMTSLNLTGKTTLRQMAACMKKCSWVMSTESAGLHTAVALSIPTVGLVGGHHLGRFYPWGKPSINRTAKIDCAGVHCNKKCIHDRMLCVEDIPVETVLREFNIAVENSRRGASCR